MSVGRNVLIEKQLIMLEAIYQANKSLKLDWSNKTDKYDPRVSLSSDRE